jgi:glycosyltransferase involved in cell wall biosynthesis
MQLTPTSENALRRGVVLYDFLHCRGGAEKVTLTLMRAFPNAILCVAYRNTEHFPEPTQGLTKLIDLGVRARFPGGRTILGSLAFRLSTRWLRSYDWAIFSGSVSVEAVHQRYGGVNFYYCHTIPRFAYDLADYYLTQAPPLARPLLRLVAWLTRRRYSGALAKMDVIIANSENVRLRLERYLGMSASVIYPPCDVANYRWKGQGDYYLSTARLEPYKRVDRIVKAFAQMPDKKLIVVSGGSDESRLRALAQGAANISFLGWVSECKLRTLVSQCIATVYIPRNEDFGMSPVESMAAGKPVIGVAEGGLLETIVPLRTGLLIAGEPHEDALKSAIRTMTPEYALGMRADCEARAKRFSVDRFIEQMRSVVESHIPHRA